jgi:hypothetical protein
MNMKKILKKFIPAYKKLDDEIEPKLKNIGMKLEIIEEKQDIIDPKLKLIEKKTSAIEEKMDTLVKRKERKLFKRPCYSQDGEDVVLSSFYEEKPGYKGFFVDIGALHPLRFSNTQYFYEKGWSGINVDATPGSMDEFNKIRPRDINIEAGISSEKKKLTFYCFEEPALNSFNEDISDDRIRDGWKLKEKKIIETFSINEILENNLPKGQHIDFLNVDVEGLDFEILKSLDWGKYHPDFLLVEDLEIIDKDIIGYEKSEIYQFLVGKGYSILARTRRTLIFKKYKKLNKHIIYG